MPARKASDIASLRAALREGDPQKVAALVAGGADLHFKDEHDYDALIDAVHGRPISSDSRLIEILELLIAHRVCLSGVSSYSDRVCACSRASGGSMRFVCCWVLVLIAVSFSGRL